MLGKVLKILAIELSSVQLTVTFAEMNFQAKFLKANIALGALIISHHLLQTQHKATYHPRITTRVTPKQPGSYTCPHDMFKCPDHYCIRLGYVCDGYWDCPQGYDEINCQNISHPGYFRCRNSLQMQILRNCLVNTFIFITIFREITFITCPRS